MNILSLFLLFVLCFGQPLWSASDGVCDVENDKEDFIPPARPSTSVVDSDVSSDKEQRTPTSKIFPFWFVVKKNDQGELEYQEVHEKPKDHDTYEMQFIIKSAKKQLKDRGVPFNKYTYTRLLKKAVFFKNNEFYTDSKVLECLNLMSAAPDPKTIVCNIAQSYEEEFYMLASISALRKLLEHIEGEERENGEQISLLIKVIADRVTNQGYYHPFYKGTSSILSMATYDPD